MSISNKKEGRKIKKKERILISTSFVVVNWIFFMYSLFYHMSIEPQTSPLGGKKRDS